MFISSYHDRKSDKVLVWEKSESGKRVKREFDSPYYFYVPSKSGTFTAITGEALEKLEFNSKQDFDNACYKYEKRFESDLHPQEKIMMTYFGKPLPKLVIGFLDIEVDYNPSIGFSRPSNPYAPISSITLYRNDLETYFTLAVPPPEWGDKQLPIELSEDNYFLFRSEREMLEQFLILIEETDVLTGWNSEFFDMPYIAKRIELLFGQQALRKLSFEGGPPPRWSDKIRFKGGTEKELIIDLVTRVHLDYMALFKKFNLGGRQSYALNAIGEEEINEQKLEYDGSLYDLYHTDFIKYIEYNRHDVRIIVKLDKKFRYIELANAMVHEATVNFSAIFGSVQLIDTAIINFCHARLNKIMFDNVHKSGQKVEGALVMSPKIGLHKMIGSVDINSLYPSTYRSLNLSPEKIIGQLAEYEEGWRSIYDGMLFPDDEAIQNKIVTIIPEKSDERVQFTVHDMIIFLKENKFAVSGYGTILDQSSGEGLIPAILTYWFNGRKELQALKKEHAKKADEVLKEVNGDKTDSRYLEHINLSEYYDMLQGVRKVLLNSTYGATLNEFCRVHDPRLGASTTGSGRQITTFMINTVSKCLIGENSPKVIKSIGHDEKTGDAINVYTVDTPDGVGPIYSDTDSVVGDTLVTVLDHTMKIEDAFNTLANNYGIQNTNGKEMVWVNPNVVSALSLSGHLPLKSIYRHRTSKKRFRITIESGKFVDVTEDHSIMVERNGKLIEIKPLEINRDTDICISIGIQHDQMP